MAARETVRAVAGEGLEGDRYFADSGSFSEGSRPAADLTLVGAAVLDRVAERYDVDLAPGVHRRNVTVRGVAVDDHVGRRLRLGEAVVRATSRMTPCTYLERELAARGVADPSVPRGGVRCRIERGGEIAVGDDATVIR